MAWIKTVEEQEATGALRDFYEGIKRQMRFVPNILKVYSLRPDVLQAMQSFYEALMFGPSGINRAEREMIAMLVSKLNNCHYWTEAHGEFLRHETRNDELVTQIKEDYRRASLDQKTRMMLEHAERLTRDASKIAREDIEQLRIAGLSDEEILSLTLIASFFNLQDRVADGLGVELDAAFHR